MENFHFLETNFEHFCFCVHVYRTDIITLQSQKVATCCKLFISEPIGQLMGTVCGSAGACNDTSMQTYTQAQPSP